MPRKYSPRLSRFNSAPPRRQMPKRPQLEPRRCTSAANLEKAFYGFEPDFFQQNLLRIVDDVVSVIKGSIELWPTLIEICYFHKQRAGLPQIRVQNQQK